MTNEADTWLIEDQDIPSDTPDAMANPWKLLVVDDDASVHDVTELILDELELDGRGIQFFHAYSGQEALQLLRSESGIGVILLDVVMETDRAGLDLVNQIRNGLGNHLVRIILRTGQPGQAPEREVITSFDINDYKEKTELTASKLFSTVFTALRGYRDLTSLDKSRRGLEHIISASRSLYDISSLEEFIHGVLMQLEALLGADGGSFFSKSLGVLNISGDASIEDQRIVAGTGEYAQLAHSVLKHAVAPAVLDAISKGFNEHRSFIASDGMVVDLRGSNGRDGLLYLSGRNRELEPVERNLLDVFTGNASVALNNLYLNQEIDYTQQEVLYTLGQIAEFRSRETGCHVARMSKCAELLARLAGLESDECHIVMLAATMHDIGKIAIPDAILNKPGRLTPEEWRIMQSHAELGYRLLQGSSRPLLRAAATIAREHHEKWDGNGYPHGLAGTDIHLYGRIAAIADVFDALGNPRCYKQAWQPEAVLKYMQNQRERQFDPQLIDLFVSHFDEFQAIRREYSDSKNSPPGLFS
jgi:response regulator RpfG family c-di-GMP phosphodiesterase